MSNRLKEKDRKNKERSLIFSDFIGFLHYHDRTLHFCDSWNWASNCRQYISAVIITLTERNSRWTIPSTQFHQTPKLFVDGSSCWIILVYFALYHCEMLILHHQPLIYTKTAKCIYMNADIHSYFTVGFIIRYPFAKFKHLSKLFQMIVNY